MIPRPPAVRGVTHKIETDYQSLYVTVNRTEDGRPFEVFAHVGKAGGFTDSFTEAIARLASLVLRSGVDPAALVKQLRGVGGNESVPNGIASVLVLELGLKESDDHFPNP